MNKVLKIIWILLLPFIGYTQCDGEIRFVDSLGHDVDSMYADPIYVYHNGNDTLYLNGLYDRSSIYTYPFNISILSDSMIKEPRDTFRYCVTCSRKKIQVLDSIDLNNDGVKELFLYREWFCSSTPRKPSTDNPLGININPFGIGIYRHYYAQYEVWNVKEKLKIFEVKNRNESDVAVSTSVGKSFGYWFQVEMDRNGHFKLSHNSEVPIEDYEMGEYKYDRKRNTYIKK